MTRKVLFASVVLLVAVSAMIGCKSVETTSAMLHNQHGRHDLAIQKANEALAKNPSDAEAEFQLGVAYSYLDSTALAYEHYTTAAQEFYKAVQADPRDQRGYFQLGTTYTRLGDAAADSSAERLDYYAKAVGNFDKVLELARPTDTHYTDALSIAGQVLSRSGRPEEAASRFTRLVEEDPTNYRVIENIGNELIDSRDWKGAALFLELAAQARAKIGQDDFTLFYNLGVAYFNMGKDAPDRPTLEKSVEYYEKALVLNPDEPSTVRNVVVALVYAENWRKAAEWGERYAGLKANDPDGWRLLTRIYNELGDREKARRCELRYDELRKGGSGSE
jgi:tetratricopeptide (TPR) repeat protein